MTHENSKLTIGIQGVRASFHDVAAQTYFAGLDISLNECNSFRKLCDVLESKESDFSLMAIENSIAGSILPNYLLLEKYKFKIIGEQYLRIKMNIMALPGSSIKNIKIVQSHPMALFQCEDYLARYPYLSVLEASDTADSAKYIKENNLIHHAAIASDLAAKVYGLEILDAEIETDKQNYTRFLIISRGDKFKLNEVPTKASMRFEISHRPGCLNSILAIFAKYNLNMTKLQSVPIIGRPYEYSFHVDLEWENYDSYLLGMNEFKEVAINIIHFGEYAKSQRMLN